MAAVGRAALWAVTLGLLLTRVFAPTVAPREEWRWGPCMNISGTGCASAAGHQHFMLWWLPVAALYAKDMSQSAPLLTLFSPLQGSVHGKGVFHIALQIDRSHGRKICVQALIDFEFEIDLMLPNMGSGSREWPSSVDAMLDEQPGQHALTISMFTPFDDVAADAERDACSDLSEQVLIYETSVSFTVLAGLFARARMRQRGSILNCLNKIQVLSESIKSCTHSRPWSWLAPARFLTELSTG
eukprot:3635918-Rhodomonas_salina.1